MLAAIATAVPLPYLSLISLATWSQTSALREEITTFAPCSAMRSAIARPMPRVEPVMTATLPFMSNKLMRFSPRFRFQRLPPVSFLISGKLGLRNFRSRRLMHRRVPGIGHPWLLVDHRQPPDAAPGGCKMVKPRHRAVVDVEGEPALRQSAERETHGRLDGAAMADDNHVPARLRFGDALDRVAGAVVEIHETFAAGRRLVDGGEPVAAGRTARQKLRAIHALPLAEMLFGERRL